MNTEQILSSALSLALQKIKYLQAKRRKERKLSIKIRKKFDFMDKTIVRLNLDIYNNIQDYNKLKEEVESLQTENYKFALENEGLREKNERLINEGISQSDLDARCEKEQKEYDNLYRNYLDLQSENEKLKEKLEYLQSSVSSVSYFENPK